MRPRGAGLCWDAATQRASAFRRHSPSGWAVCGCMRACALEANVQEAASGIPAAVAIKVTTDLLMSLRFLKRNCTRLYRWGILKPSHYWWVRVVRAACGQVIFREAMLAWWMALGSPGERLAIKARIWCGPVQVPFR